VQLELVVTPFASFMMQKLKRSRLWMVLEGIGVKRVRLTIQGNELTYWKCQLLCDRSPAALTLEYAKNTLGFDGLEIPAKDLNSVTVPGAAAAWVDTVEKLGSGKLSLADVLAPAIDLAENGQVR
jgi:hypothetical protein